MDVTMLIFHVFFRYNKINKIKFIEIMKKETHLSKFIIINLPIMEKSNQNHGSLIINGLLNFAHAF
jgi:hypothetical protein